RRRRARVCGEDERERCKHGGEAVHANKTGAERVVFRGPLTSGRECATFDPGWRRSVESTGRGTRAYGQAVTPLCGGMRGGRGVRGDRYRNRERGGRAE